MLDVRSAAGGLTFTLIPLSFFAHSPFAGRFALSLSSFAVRLSHSNTLSLHLLSLPAFHDRLVFRGKIAVSLLSLLCFRGTQSQAVARSLASSSLAAIQLLSGKIFPSFLCPLLEQTDSVCLNPSHDHHLCLISLSPPCTPAAARIIVRVDES